MKKSKLLLASLLAMLIIASTVFASMSMALDKGTVEAYGTQTWGFNPSSQSAVSVTDFTKGQIAAYRVNIGAHFDYLELNLIASVNNQMVAKFSLFKWAGDYNTTITGKNSAGNYAYLLWQSAEQTWGQGNNIYMDPGKVCAPGEYLITIYVPSSSPVDGAVFTDPNTSISKGITYINGSQVSGKGDWRIAVYMTETVSTKFYTPGTAFTTTCADTNNDHKCEKCGDQLSNCVNADNDHFCDVCGGPATACVDTTPKDHKCDIEGCGKVLSSCVDDDNTAYCDVCGEKMPPQDLTYATAHVWACNTNNLSLWEIPWSEYGVRMHLAGRFNAAMFSVATWTNTNVRASFGVFKWVDSYQYSLQHPVMIAENVSVVDGHNWFNFDPQDPGEYLFVIYDISTPINTQTMGIYRAPNNAVSHCQTFENGWASYGVDNSICIQFTKYLSNDQFLPLDSDPIIFYDEVTTEEQTTVETEAPTTEAPTTEATTEEITTEAEVTTTEAEETTTEEEVTTTEAEETTTEEEITTTEAEETTTEEEITTTEAVETTTEEEVTTTEAEVTTTEEEVTTTEEEETTTRPERPRPTVSTSSKDEEESESQSENTDNNDDDNNDDDDSDVQTVKKKGCGSSVGGIAIIAISVAGGISYATRKNKKED